MPCPRLTPRLSNPQPIQTVFADSTAQQVAGLVSGLAGAVTNIVSAVGEAEDDENLLELKKELSSLKDGKDQGKITSLAQLNTMKEAITLRYQEANPDQLKEMEQVLNISKGSAYSKQLATQEAQAFKEQEQLKADYKEAGIDIDDPDASIKLDTYQKFKAENQWLDMKLKRKQTLESITKIDKKEQRRS